MKLVLGIKQLLLLSTGLLWLTACSQNALVGREPRLWLPDPDKIETDFPLEFRGVYSRNNEDYAQLSGNYDERLARFKEQGRIITMDYTWESVDCVEVEQLGLGIAGIKLILLETAEGAHKAFKDFEAADKEDPELEVQTVQVGEEAYVASGQYDSCDVQAQHAFIFFRRANVLAEFYIDSYSEATTNYLSRVYQEKWGKYIDELIRAEAQAHPGTTEMLSATKKSAETYISENMFWGSGAAEDENESVYGSDWASCIQIAYESHYNADQCYYHYGVPLPGDSPTEVPFYEATPEPSQP